MDMVEKLKKLSNKNKDLIIREIKYGSNFIYITFFESLCDSKSIYDYIIKNIFNTKNLDINYKSLSEIICSPKIVEITSNEILYYMENGFATVIYNSEIIAIEVKANIDRGIDKSDTEPNMYGAKDSFQENYQKNLGLIKRRVKNKNMISKDLEIGINTKTKVSILYLENMVNCEYINYIYNEIKNIQEDELDTLKNILKIVDGKNIFPTIYKTEKPNIASKYILEGHPIILVDNNPFILILNMKLKNIINPLIMSKFSKLLRFICFLLTIITPALYISLINFNQESIPTDLLLNFSIQRNNVPFLAIIECLIMLFICELLRETDIRFPSSYGSSASILGALILGDAAVNAGIVSPIMIIIIAITFISNLIFTETKLCNSIRLARIIMLLFSAFFGLYGLSLCIILIICLLANNKIEGDTYI